MEISVVMKTFQASMLEAGYVNLRYTSRSFWHYCCMDIRDIKREFYGNTEA